jgi:hypothetical protein
VAISYSIASLVNEEMHPSGSESTQSNLLYATAMTNILFALAVTSILSTRGYNIPAWAVVNWFLAPPTLVLAVIALATRLKRDGAIDRFGSMNIILLFFQLIFLVTSSIPIRQYPGKRGTLIHRLQQPRYFVSHSLFLIIASILAMFIAGRFGCSVDFHTWSYSQVFSGSTGCASLYVTWVRSFKSLDYEAEGFNRPKSPESEYQGECSIG